MKKFIKNIIGKKNTIDHKNRKIDLYIKNGKVPWSVGYVEYKFQKLVETINSKDYLKYFNENRLPNDFGYRLDERIVEIPWVISKLSDCKSKLLDAGSSLNYIDIINSEKIKVKDLTIFTFDPEENNFNTKRISYVYADLRDLPFRDNLFDEIACISTIEHIDMDNSIYGWNENNAKINNETKSYEYLKVVKELFRVLKPKGKLFLTFPFGKFENHGFFQQFDAEMLVKITAFFESKGSIELTFFKYENDSWNFAELDELSNFESFNPHTGRGKGNDGAAHCRSVCCIEFQKL